MLELVPLEVKEQLTSSRRKGRSSKIGTAAQGAVSTEGSKGEEAIPEEDSDDSMGRLMVDEDVSFSFVAETSLGKRQEEEDTQPEWEWEEGGVTTSAELEDQAAIEVQKETAKQLEAPSNAVDFDDMVAREETPAVKKILKKGLSISIMKKDKLANKDVDMTVAAGESSLNEQINIERKKASLQPPETEKDVEDHNSVEVQQEENPKSKRKVRKATAAKKSGQTLKNIKKDSSTQWSVQKMKPSIEASPKGALEMSIEDNLQESSKTVMEASEDVKEIKEDTKEIIEDAVEMPETGVEAQDESSAAAAPAEALAAEEASVTCSLCPPGPGKDLVYTKRQVIIK